MALADCVEQAGRITELAVAAADRGDFLAGLVDVLRASIGFDMAGFANTVDGRKHELFAPGYGACPPGSRMTAYLSEFQPLELRRAWGGQMVNDVDVITPARRDSMAIYRELFKPQGITVLTTTAWRHRYGAFAFHVARGGRGDRFKDSELKRLDRLLGSIRIAEAFISANEAAMHSPFARHFDDWASFVGLSAGERRVAELVARGLHNREIATVLGVSPNTIRNQISAVFRKGQVTTRAEMVFAVNCTDGSADLRLPSASVRTKAPWLDLVRAHLSNRAVAIPR